jgi:general stress protein 26
MGEDRERWDLDFGEKRHELVRFLESRDNAIMALATSQADRVMVRSILVGCRDLDIYFFTWGHSRKCEQIRANPRVALCRDSIQIEGTAEILGDLFDDRNRDGLELLQQKFPDAIDYWRDRPGMVLVKVSPTAAVIAGGSGEEPNLKFLDLERKVAYAERWAHY